MTKTKIQSPVDLIYMEGPGDIVEALSQWHADKDFISHTSITFSAQVFEFGKKNNLNTLAISALDADDKEVIFDQFAGFSKRKWLPNGTLGYYLSQIAYGLKIIYWAIKYKPKYLHIVNGATFWFILAPLKLLNIKIYPQFHNTLWAKGFPPTGKVKRILLKLDAWFFNNIATEALCCSPEIKRQIEEICKNNNCPIHVFKAQFYRHSFEKALPSVPHKQKPFTIVFAGRVETNKGVFDILEMARTLQSENVKFHICGGGSALSDLEAACKEQELENIVEIHGMLVRPDLIDVYAKGHAVIVPTRKDFCEGLPMVAIEAILLGRPIITSGLSNALDVLGTAIAEVEPENIDDYVAIIRKLMKDEKYYNEKSLACHVLREQFLDGKDGLESMMQKTISS